MKGATGAESTDERPLGQLIVPVAAGSIGAVNAFAYADGLKTVLWLVVCAALFVVGVAGLVMRQRSMKAAQRHGG